MNNKVVAEFSANGTRIQLIAHNEGRDGYTFYSDIAGKLNSEDD